MGEYSQQDRPMRVKIAGIGEDDLLLAGFSGKEGISQLFSFELDLLSEHTKKGENPVPKQIAIDDLLGKNVTLEMEVSDGQKRYFNGICNRISQGGMDDNFTRYEMEVVPKFWLLTRIKRSRIFQPPDSAVPKILEAVLEGISIDNKIQGTFHPRDYIVQYQETDWEFVSRIMQEEGIYYYFEHEDGDHKMVLSNTPTNHADVPIATEIIYESTSGGSGFENRIYSWSKHQELRSGKYTLWDYCFEKPDSKLDATAEIQANVAVGADSHKLKVADNSNYEIYDYPGEYAQRFDGIDKGGGEQPAEIEKIFEDNTRTVGIRMQQEAVESMRIVGDSNCRQMVSGHKFSLTRHVNANGEYVLTTITHSGSDLSYRSDTGGFKYNNSFTCIPSALPYRPQRLIPKPLVHGTLTAVVVGPSGEEIFTDKYGRVKVQFHWDREGKNNADSSCWVRVGTMWAGTQWGMIHIPRIGHEVIVDFIGGDPDRPIIIGSVYNAANMPPYKLPDNKTQSGIKSRSSLNGNQDNFNEIRFEDKKGEEQLFIHAEKNQDIEVENDETHWVGRDRKKTIDRDETNHIKRDRTETVDRDEKITIHRNRTEEVDKEEKITIHGGRTEEVDKDEKITIHGNRSETVDKDESISIGGKRTESVSKDESITISGNRSESVSKDESVTVSGNRSHTVSKSDSLSVSKALSITAGDSITLTTGKASITMKKDGTIVIKGKDITVQGSGKVTGKATKNMVLKGKKILEN